MGRVLLNQIRGARSRDPGGGEPVREWSWIQPKFICSPHRSLDNSCSPVTTETTVARQQASISVHTGEKGITVSASVLHSENWNSYRLVWGKTKKRKKKSRMHLWHTAGGSHRCTEERRQRHENTVRTHHAVVTVSSASPLAADGEVQINRASSVVGVA